MKKGKCTIYWNSWVWVALIDQGGSAFFHFLPCLGESETSAACGKSLKVKGLRKKGSGHLSSGKQSKI